MSDPIISDAVVEGGKNVGNAGGLLALGYMIVNIFKKKVEVDDAREAKALEAVAAELKSLNAGVSEIKLDVKLVMQAHAATRADLDKAELKIELIQREMGELVGAFKLLREQVGK
ncbi:MAG: hypothetical protein Q8K32_09280 [Archangium sp.]|nr:hypothetical protein [Archangium sp.]